MPGRDRRPGEEREDEAQERDVIGGPAPARVEPEQGTGKTRNEGAEGMVDHAATPRWRAR